MATTVKPHQCLMDIVLREAGAIHALFDLAAGNDINITDDLTGGMILQTAMIKPVNETVISYYRDQQIFPGTATTIQQSSTQSSGIGYMGIGIDFKIS
jgi:hypothetical protein